MILLSRRRVASGHVAPEPPPGVYALHDAVDMPALLPDGSTTARSVSKAVTQRDVDLGRDAQPDVTADLEAEDRIDDVVLALASGMVYRHTRREYLLWWTGVWVVSTVYYLAVMSLVLAGQNLEFPAGQGGLSTTRIELPPAGFEITGRHLANGCLKLQLHKL